MRGGYKVKKFVAVCLTMILLIGIVVQPSNVEAKDLPSFTPKLRILEIVDKGSWNNGLYQVSSKLSTPLKGEDFEITTMTMKQFVASREELDGKYDIIAIPEGDYSPAAVQGKDHATQNVLNDITNLKANEIINQFINKGQPVILESKSLQNSTRNQKNKIVKEGNLEKYFYEVYKNNTKNNVIFYNGNGNSKQGDLIAHLGNFFKVKQNGYEYYKPRPRFELVTQPSASQVYKSGETLQFKLNMTRPTDVTAKDLKAFLYIDSDFNDKYDATEVVLEKPVTSLTDTLSYELPRGYSGIRNWKLEVVDMGTNMKDYQKGTIHFKDQKVEVDVLQIQRSSTDPSSLKKLII